MPKSKCLAALALTLAVAASVAGCAPQTPVGANTTAVYSDEVTAQVTSVDPVRRQLVLQSRDGQVALVNVPPDVQNFDQIRVGDTVRVTYASEIDIVVSGHVTPMPGVIVRTAAETAPPGKRPAGIWGVQTQRSVQILSVDRATHTVTFREPDGSVDSIVVRDPANFALADGLAPGTVVQVIHTQGIAASVSKL